jgi:hypothetical protein
VIFLIYLIRSKKAMSGNDGELRRGKTNPGLSSFPAPCDKKNYGIMGVDIVPVFC